MVWRACTLSLVLACGCASSASPVDIGNNEPASPDTPAFPGPDSKEPDSNDAASGTRLTTRERLSRSTLDLPREQLPNGMLKLELNHRFAHANVARRTADGKLHVECVDRASALDHALGSTP
jgi:hypothetical protein